MAGFDPVIPAGGSGKLTAKVKTHATQQGHLTKVVTVTTDDPVAKTIQLKLSFDVQPAIEVRPQARPSIEVVEGNAAEKTLVLHRADGKPLEISRIDTGAPNLVTATVRPATKKDRALGAAEGDVILEIKTKKLSGFTQRSQMLTLHTNHPRLKQMRLPIRIRVKPVIAAMPAQVRLWAPPGEKVQELTSVLTVRSNDGKKFTVTAVESSDPALITAEIKDNRPAVRHNIVLRVPAKAIEALERHTKRAQLTIRTGDSRKPTLTVPVIVARRRNPNRPPGGIPIRSMRSLPGTPKDMILSPRGQGHLKLVPKAQDLKPATPTPSPAAAPEGTAAQEDGGKG